MVYTTPPDNINQLQDRITQEINSLIENPEVVRRAVQAMRLKAQLCLVRNGGHVEANGA